MTERERWIVYPLLFLALGSGLRDKLFDQTRSKSIVCQELMVLSEDPGGRGQPRILARIGAPEGAMASTSPPVQMVLDGPLYSDTVCANNYVYRQMPFAPPMLRAIPGLSPADLMRAMQQAAEAQGGQKPKSQSTEPGTQPQQPTAPARTPGNAPADNQPPATPPAK